jgi:hypothetical protein
LLLAAAHAGVVASPKHPRQVNCLSAPVFSGFKPSASPVFSGLIKHPNCFASQDQLLLPPPNSVSPRFMSGQEFCTKNLIINQAASSASGFGCGNQLLLPLPNSLRPRFVSWSRTILQVNDRHCGGCRTYRVRRHLAFCEQNRKTMRKFCELVTHHPASL